MKPTRSILILTIFTVFAILVMSPYCRATTYYVDASNGNDSNPGTSQSNAWKTISKVNNSNFQPGDNIVFKRGEIWREQLTVPSSGASGYPIKFGAYGIGGDPIINGADIISNWNHEGASIYSATLTTEPHQVFYNGTRLIKDDGSLTSVDFNEWDWDSNTLYINLGEDQSIGTVEVSQRNYSIRVIDKSFITIDGIHTTMANADGIKFDATYGNTRHNIAQNCISDWNYGNGIIAENDSNSGSFYTIEGNSSSYNGGSGILINWGIVDSIVSRNTTHHNGSVEEYSAGIRTYHGGNTSRDDNVTIENNLSYSNIKTSTFGGDGIHIDMPGDNFLVRYNKIYDNDGNGIQSEANFSSTDTNGPHIYYNLIYSNKGFGIFVNNRDDILSPTNKANHIYNNSVYDNAVGIYLYNDGIANCNNNEVKNNISSGNITRAFAAISGCSNDGVSGSRNIYTYNCFGSESSNFIEWGSRTYKSSYSEWETAYGATTHSIEAAPDFNDPHNYNFTLQVKSPCINAGVNLGANYDKALFHTSSWPDSVVTVSQDNFGSRWEIGAYVKSTLSPPSDLHIINTILR